MQDGEFYFARNMVAALIGNAVEHKPHAAETVAEGLRQKGNVAEVLVAGKIPVGSSIRVVFDQHRDMVFLFQIRLEIKIFIDAVDQVDFPIRDDAADGNADDVVFPIAVDGGV